MSRQQKVARHDYENAVSLFLLIRPAQQPWIDFRNRTTCTVAEDDILIGEGVFYCFSALYRRGR